jgi:hypothetical protein
MNPSKKSKLTVFVLILPLAIILFCFFGYIFVLCVLEPEMGAKYESPANPANKILFSYGDVDELALFVEPKKGKPQFVALLEEDGAFRLGDFQWTKDGQAVVCSLMLLGEITTNDYAPLSPVIAYDFSTGKATIPAWLGFNPTNDNPRYKESNWREFEPTIGKIIAAHGGLSDKRVDFYMVHDHEKRHWFWQNPTVPQRM